MGSCTQYAFNLTCIKSYQQMALKICEEKMDGTSFINDFMKTYTIYRG